MQIHEITKFNKQRTDEGLLDTFKQTVGITPKPGATEPTKFQKMTSPSLRAAAQNEKARGPAAASIAKLKAQGYDVSSAEEALAGYSQAQTPQQAAAKAQEKADIDKLLNQAIQQTQQDTQVQATINQDVKEFGEEFPILPDPGTRFEVTTANGGKYYKDEKGQWTNENGEAVTGSTTNLDQTVDAGGAKQVPVTKPAPAAPIKGKQQQPVAESILQEGKTLAQTDLENFVGQKVTGKDDAGHPINFAEVLQIPQVKKRLRNIFVTMYKANNAKPPDRKAVIEGFKQYMTVAFAGLKIVEHLRSNGTSEVGDDAEIDNFDGRNNIEVDEKTADQIANMLTKTPAKQRKATLQKAIDTVKNNRR